MKNIFKKLDDLFDKFLRKFFYSLGGAAAFDRDDEDVDD